GASVAGGMPRLCAPAGETARTAQPANSEARSPARKAPAGVEREILGAIDRLSAYLIAILSQS
ncbi:MAG TPA: hypothetical protein VD840_10830, partial [Sinorhizobium sp.]|nr:hypothetical protein [Sinorhizobium sp.]